MFGTRSPDGLAIDQGGGSSWLMLTPPDIAMPTVRSRAVSSKGLDLGTAANQ